MLVVTQDVAIVCRSRTNNNSETKAAAIAPLAAAAAVTAATATGAPKSDSRESGLCVYFRVCRAAESIHETRSKTTKQSKRLPRVATSPSAIRL